MRPTLRALTLPPRFGDRELTRRAAVNHKLIVYTITVGVLGLITVPLISGMDRAALVSGYGIFLALSLAAFGLNRRGAVSWSGGLSLLAMFCATTYVALQSGGVHSIAIVAYAVIVYAAGSIAGGRTAVLLAATSSAVVLGMALSQSRGWLPGGDLGSPLDAWVIFNIITFGALAVLGVALGGVRESIENASRSERQLRETIEQSPDGILSMDEAQHVRNVNRAAEVILGRPRAALLGASLPSLGLVEEEDAVLLGAILSCAAAGDTLEPREFEVERPDGSVAAVEINARGVSHEGERRAIQLSLRDVTERRRLEREKNALELERQHAQRLEAIGKLAGGVAHDFNNYLTVILGNCELLEAGLRDKSAQARAVHQIANAALHSAQLTRQLLAFGRRQALEPRVVRVNELIDSLEPMLRRLLGEQVRIRTLTRAEPDAIFADPNQLEVALINLAVNARDAMPNGGDLTLETGRVNLAGGAARALKLEPGPHIQVAVSDTGIGMEEAVQEHIFEPFFTTKASGEGIGIGLSTVYGIVRQSDGAIRVDSEPGRGARFEILLPFRSEAMDSARTGTQVETASERRGRVLLVEDEAPVRTVVRSMLQSRGFEVVEAEHGREALDRLAAAKHPIDVVLSDVVMPDLGGLELCERLKRVAPGLPVVLMSGYPEEHLSSGSEYGKREILSKPFSRQQLVARIEAALNDARERE